MIGSAWHSYYNNLKQTRITRCYHKSGHMGGLIKCVIYYRCEYNGQKTSGVYSSVIVKCWRKRSPQWLLYRGPLYFSGATTKECKTRVIPGGLYQTFFFVEPIEIFFFKLEVWFSMGTGHICTRHKAWILQGVGQI